MDETYQSALGELVIAFNSLEEALTIGLSEITDLDYPSAAIIFGSTSFKHKCKIIWGLAQCSRGRRSDLDNLKILLAESSKVEESRNRLLHSDWTLHQIGSMIERRREKVRYSKSGSCLICERFDVDDIIRVASHCWDCVTLLESWFIDGDFDWWDKPLPWGLMHRSEET